MLSESYCKQRSSSERQTEWPEGVLSFFSRSVILNLHFSTVEEIYTSLFAAQEEGNRIFVFSEHWTQHFGSASDVGAGAGMFRVIWNKAVGFKLFDGVEQAACKFYQN